MGHDFNPNPIEIFHSYLMRFFHEYRESKTDKTTIPIDGNIFAEIVVKAKNAVYNKYPDIKGIKDNYQWK